MESQTLKFEFPNSSHNQRLCELIPEHRGISLVERTKPPKGPHNEHKDEFDLAPLALRLDCSNLFSRDVSTRLCLVALDSPQSASAFVIVSFLDDDT